MFPFVSRNVIARMLPKAGSGFLSQRQHNPSSGALVELVRVSSLFFVDFNPWNVITRNNNNNNNYNYNYNYNNNNNSNNQRNRKETEAETTQVLTSVEQKQRMYK